MPFSDCKSGKWYVVVTCESCGTRQPIYRDPSKGKAKLKPTIARCKFCGRNHFYNATDFERYKHSDSGPLRNDFAQA